MAIKKVLENGKCKYEVIVKIRDKSGKQLMRRKRWFSSEREARKVELDILMELEGHKSKIFWKKWIEHVLEKYRVEYRASTYWNYKHCLDKWFNPIWNDKFIDEIKPSDVHKAIFETASGVSSYTQRGLLKIVKRIFNIAIEEGVIVRNPAVGIRVRCADANQSVLNRNEVEILLKEAQRVDHRFFPHWALALLSGMRSGELYSLRWTDVDLVTGKINISKAWTRYNGEGPTKTAKNRICPISSECRRFLEKLKLQHAKDSEYVLPRIWEWDQGEQAKVLKNFCQEIGITPIKFHDLRATFITQMLNNGVPLSKVMAIVGHSSLKTTQGYLRLSGKDIEGATEDLNIQVPEAEERLANVVELRRR
ncbi:MAG: tyrosine-type recombinase/integrase [Desulforhabdus sp.]|jgi:integrase|nr:tyrosine-type recombinase/integrase [Desulforhabdus sp.]